MYFKEEEFTFHYVLYYENKHTVIVIYQIYVLKKNKHQSK